MQKTFHFVTAGLLLGCVLAAGISTAASAAPAPSQSARPIESLEPNKAGVKEVLAIPLTELPAIKPADSGPGIMVCDPQTPAGGDAIAFGKGCGRWLHYQVAGQPQFGKSLYWSNYGYSLREINLANGIPSQAQALEMGKMQALTHVAIGTLEGTPEQGVLTYRLWKLPERKVVGEPIVVKGDRSQIVEGLPGIAKTLVARLKGEENLVANTVELSAAQLTQLGGFPNTSERPLSDEDAQKLQALTTVSPVALFPYLTYLTTIQELDSGTRPRSGAQEAALQLARAAGQNTVALAHAVANAPDKAALLPYWQPLATRYPNNYLLAFIETRWHSSRKDRTAQRKAALRALAATPSNAWAWLGWDGVLSAEAQDERKGKFINNLTEKQLEYLGERYVQATEASLKAVQCDPRSAAAWESVASSATFAGDGDLGDIAMRQALSLPSRNASAYKWGLQMYQSKWLDEPEKLRRVAQMLAADRPNFIVHSLRIIEAFEASGMPEDAREYRLLAFKRMNEWLAENPQDHYARIAYAYRLLDEGQEESAFQQFQLIIKNHPDQEEGYLGLASIYEGRKDWPKTAQYYQESLKHEPDRAIVYHRCGIAFYEMKEYDQAQKCYEKAILLDPRKAETYSRLGDVYYFGKANYTEAEKLYRKAVQLDPNFGFYRKNLERSLAAQGKKPE